MFSLHGVSEAVCEREAASSARAARGLGFWPIFGVVLSHGFLVTNRKRNLPKLLEITSILYMHGEAVWKFII